MRNRLRAALAGAPALAGLLLLVSLLAAPSMASALGLGPLELKSRLNQRLEARIALVGIKAGDLEGLRVGLAGEEVFARQGIEPVAIHLGLQFEVISTGPASGYIEVRSRVTIREPSLQFVVEAYVEGGRSLRTYAVLLNAG